MSDALRIDPRIDAYIEKSADFARPILQLLREQVHRACPETVEAIKWGMPHFLLDGKILAGMAAFKAHCTFGFWQRGAAGDEAAEGKRSEAMGQYGRIEKLADLPAQRELQRQIKQAAALIRSGAKSSLERKPRPRLEAPADLLAALAADAKARATFEAFPPGKQRDYIEWITEAKREDTRAKRLAQSVEWLAEGKARHWKYEAC
ncbi:YdeI/OmpD-associated family protein [Roseateles violae]|uniref:YdeI/OmpD-associated family protein n=1 Tax=Roseateles violae TaxID=3058042 RepID=A0ABT8DYL8_9BURK|nr:YdeI/OmpD-associated family protein [Pelomonas sp. PFR6]MDN3922672.1 YdeI/OmpD-associated family protein [Pelomonas sp. PFR6]